MPSQENVTLDTSYFTMLSQDSLQTLHTSSCPVKTMSLHTFSCPVKQCHFRHVILHHAQSRQCHFILSHAQSKQCHFRHVILYHAQSRLTSEYSYFTMPSQDNVFSYFTMPSQDNVTPDTSYSKVPIHSNPDCFSDGFYYFSICSFNFNCLWPLTWRALLLSFYLYFWHWNYWTTSKCWHWDVKFNKSIRVLPFFYIFFYLKLLMHFSFTCHYPWGYIYWWQPTTNSHG